MKLIVLILWSGFKVDASNDEHDFTLFKVFKIYVNIDFMFIVKCTNFKS
jgi:hypothetical protein